MRLRSTLLIVICIATFFFVASDVGRGMGLFMDQKCKKWIETFFKMPPSEQIKIFSSYTIEDQYSIYICGNQIFHPPAIYIARPFATQGNLAADFLKTRLLQTKDDLTIRDIVFVFEEMNRQKTYNVRKDGDLMKLIKDRIDGMNNKDWKRTTEEMLQEMKE